ncbi:MAG: hypothetical protein U5M51_01345 [Emticicia sp.]|nr:hypothetical protein [Emticicia sp.]
MPAYTWAGTVAYSRLHLGVHYQSDVYGWGSYRCGSAWLCYKANHGFKRINLSGYFGYLD